jgi:tRNA(adenine34) deaminase
VRALIRWLLAGKLKEPRRVKQGGVELRIWTDADVEWARKYKTPTRRPCYSRRKMDADSEFMQEALAEAREAAAGGEVPIGAVMVHNGRILARAGNRTIRDCDPTAHAEIVTRREAARILGNYRLADTTLYVTIEPCSMCAGAMIQARVPRLVYGVDEPRGGAVQSCFGVLSHPDLNHRVQVTSGILRSDCSAVIQSFFAVRRQ